MNIFSGIHWSFQKSNFVEKGKAIVECTANGVFNIFAAEEMTKEQQLIAIADWYKAEFDRKQKQQGIGNQEACQ